MNRFIILAILAAVSVNAAFSRRQTQKNRDISSEMCQSGDGSSYRGFEYMTTYGRKCQPWSRIRHPWGDLEGVGPHSYCRNPDQSLMPWCFVRKGRRIVRQFCSIPKCSTPSTKAPPVVDTELTCGERSERRRHKIVGGSFTAIESHPWVAAIYHQDSFLCGGSLISPCWVLSAAHCFEDNLSKIKTEDLTVYLGKSAINETNVGKEQFFTVEKKISHQNFNASNYNNDIALLKIKSPDGGCAAKTPSSRTVCVPPAHTHLPVGFPCSVAGFGMVFWGGPKSQYLKQAEVRLISQADCRRESYYGDLISGNMMCAGSPDWTADACGGDSGGPLVCDVSGRLFLFGVVSWGENCAKKDKPGVYTRVSNYNNWIAEKTGLPQYTQGIMYPPK